MSDGEANIWQPRTILELSADTKRIEERLTATEGQSLFIITTFAYAVNTGALEVHKNGLLLTKGIDWVENTTTTFSLTVGATAGDQIVATGYVGITGDVDVRDTDIYISNFQAIRDYVGVEATIYARGQITAGDSYENFFQKKTGAAPGFYLDNNFNVIVPTGGDGSIGWISNRVTAKENVVIFTNVADMISGTLPDGSVITLIVGQTVQTLGYFTKGDFGSNTYEIVAASTGTDDGGSFIDLNVLQAKGLFPAGIHIVQQWAATGGGLGTDDSAEVQAAVIFAPCVFFPRTDTYYVVGDVDVPEGTVLKGCVYRKNTAFATIAEIEGRGAVAKLAGATNLFRFGTRCVIDSMFLYGVDRSSHGCQMIDDTQGANLTILNSAFHRFDRGLGTGGYLRVAEVFNTQFINNNRGSQNLIDARLGAVIFKSSQEFGTLLQAGANANQFVECRWEFDVGPGFVSSSAGGNSIIGGLIDREGEEGVRLIDSDLTMTGTILRRNGRFILGTDECTHIYMEGSTLIHSALVTTTGADDGGGGDTTPNHTISVESTASTVIGSGSDLSGAVTSVLREGTTLISKQSSNLGIEDYNNVDLLQTVDGEIFYNKQNSSDLATSATFLASYNLPAIGTFERNLFTLQVTLRNTSGGTRHGIIYMVQSREGAGATVAVGIIQESVVGAFGISGEDMELVVSNIATDGSSFDITYTNNDAATWKVFSTLIK
jgi:hypothetical protein